MNKQTNKIIFLRNVFIILITTLEYFIPCYLLDLISSKEQKTNSVTKIIKDIFLISSMKL